MKKQTNKLSLNRQSIKQLAVASGGGGATNGDTLRLCTSVNSGVISACVGVTTCREYTQTCEMTLDSFAGGVC